MTVLTDQDNLNSGSATGIHRKESEACASNIPNCLASTSPFSADRLFRTLAIALALLLLVAAGLKVRSLATGLWMTESFLSSPWLLIAAVEVEAVLGFWLLSGWWGGAAWVGSFAFFGAMASASFYLAMIGQHSCGCLGRVPVNPWIAFSFDVFVVAALTWVRPLPDLKAQAPHCLRGTLKPIVAAVLFLGIIGASTTVLSHIAGILKPDGGIIGDDKVVMLQPETWEGKRLPLLPYIETAENLSAGEWLLLLIHSDCLKCSAVLPRYVRLAEDWATQGMSSRVAVIELPPYASSAQSANVHPGTACKSGRLTQEREWFAKTPVLIKVVDGMVIEVDTNVRP